MSERIIHVKTKSYTDIIVNVGRQRVGDTWVENNGEGRMATRTSDHVLSLVGTYHRFGLGYAEPNTWTNQGEGMPRKWVTDPEGYTYGLASCISANPEMSTGAEVRRNREAGIEHDVEDGDWVVTDKQYVFRVELYRREYLRLVYLGLWKDVPLFAGAGQ